LDDDEREEVGLLIDEGEGEEERGGEERKGNATSARKGESLGGVEVMKLRVVDSRVERR